MHLTAGAMTETITLDLEHVLFGCRSRGVERGSRALLRGVRIFSGANEPAAPDETSMDTGTTRNDSRNRAVERLLPVSSSTAASHVHVIDAIVYDGICTDDVLCTTIPYCG